MTLAPLIYDLALILGVAGVVTIIFHWIRQPVVLGYILAGVLVGPRTFPVSFVQDLPNIKIWAELGVIFLMFSLGLEFSFRKLARVGLSSTLATLFEMMGVFFLGFFCGKFLGWPLFDQIFLGAMISASSTTIIVRTLDELGLRTRRFAEVLFGILIVEDLVAILLITVLSEFALGEAFSGFGLAYSSLKLLLVLGGWFLVGFFILPRFIHQVGKFSSDEVLALFSLGLCLMLSVMAARFHYSTALGAFIMGSILGESAESVRIQETIRPLRNLFAAVFFVSVGMLIDPQLAWQNAGAIGLVSLAVLCGKSFFGFVGNLIAGNSFRTAVQVGFGLSQIGELSFVIATLALLRGGNSDFLYPVAVSVSIITTFLSPYLIRFSQKWAPVLEENLPRFCQHILFRYAGWTQQLKINTSYLLPFYWLILKWFLNGIITAVLFVLASEFLVESLGAWVESAQVGAVLGWSFAALVSAPFLWAMFFTFSSPSMRARKSALLAISRVFTLFILGSLSALFFPVIYAISITAMLAALLLVSFYQQLEGLYGWFERHFLFAFLPRQQEGSMEEPALPHHLAPWDAHLTQLEVHADAEVAGRSIGEMGFRKRFGLNIIAIQRGTRVIVAPVPQVFLFPGDKLLVLGIDEAIEEAKNFIEKPILEKALTPQWQGELSNYHLKPFGVLTSSPLIGETIRHSKIREQFGAVVVGLERKGIRQINPDPDTQLSPGDVIWVVGESERLSEFLKIL